MTRGSLSRSNQWPRKCAATTRITREKRNRVSESAVIDEVLSPDGRRHRQEAVPAPDGVNQSSIPGLVRRAAIAVLPRRKRTRRRHLLPRGTVCRRWSGAGLANARIDTLARGLEIAEIVVVAPGAAGSEDGADRHAAGCEPLEGLGQAGRHIPDTDQPVDLLP